MVKVLEGLQEMQRDLDAKRASRDGLEAELLAERQAAQTAAEARQAQDTRIRSLEDQLAGVQVRVVQAILPMGPLATGIYSTCCRSAGRNHSAVMHSMMSGSVASDGMDAGRTGHGEKGS